MNTWQHYMPYYQNKSSTSRDMESGEPLAPRPTAPHRKSMEGKRFPRRDINKGEHYLSSYNARDQQIQRTWLLYFSMYEKKCAKLPEYFQDSNDIFLLCCQKKVPSAIISEDENDYVMPRRKTNNNWKEHRKIKKNECFVWTGARWMIRFWWID